MMARASKAPKFVCPKCGHVMEQADCPGNDEPPRPGDVSFCFNCIALLRFGAGLELETMGPMEEWEARMQCPEIAAHERALGALKRQQERKVQRGP